MAYFCPNYLGVPSHKPFAYLQGFGSLTQFCHLCVDDRLNCGSNEFQATHAVPPKSERQTTTLDKK
jgi:hypothetical protein